MGEFLVGNPVDIHVTSPGDVSMLACSLVHCLKWLKLDWIPENGFFKIILSSSDFRKVSEGKEHALSVPRLKCKVRGPSETAERNVTQIFWVDTGLPSADKKGFPVNWERQSYDYLQVQGEKWVHIGPIFGEYMFGRVAKAGTSTSAPDIPVPPHKKAYAYGFGDGSLTRGVLSNGEISFVGLEFNPDTAAFTPVTVTVPSFSDPMKWYEHCRNENGRKLSSWVSPLTRYSPISNCLRHNKRGAAQATTQRLLEEGNLSLEEVAFFMSMTSETNVEGELMPDVEDAPSGASTTADSSSTTTSTSSTSSSSASSSSSADTPPEPDIQGEVFSE